MTQFVVDPSGNIVVVGWFDKIVKIGNASLSTFQGGGYIYKMTATQNDIHAGEIETSTALAIRPELVDMEKAEDHTLDLDNEYLDFTSDRGVSWYVHTKRISKSGVMGNPTLGTAEKGRKYWEIMIRNLTEFVETIKNTPSDKLYQNRY